MVALVRYVNLAHKGRYFIAAGDKVLYVPEHFKNVHEEDIKLFIGLSILEDRNKGKSKVRNWAYGMVLSFGLIH